MATSLKIVQLLESGQQDMRWFDSNHQRLVTEYANKFVAIKDQKVVDSDAYVERLFERLEKKKIPTASLLIEFVTTVKTLL